MLQYSFKNENSKTAIEVIQLIFITFNFFKQI